MYNADIHHRRSIRLHDYDYSQGGAYYVTICTNERECLFGESLNGKIRLNEAGRMAQSVWEALPGRFPQIDLDEYVIMPNHFHGIIVIQNVGAPLAAPNVSNPDSKQDEASGVPTLGKIMRFFKSMSAIQVNLVLDRKGQPLWQRNYYERIIRDEKELNGIREYINANPSKWTEDKENTVFA